MNRFDFPQTLPPSKPLLPAFTEHFSGWHLGMGLPNTLLGLLPTLFQLARRDPDCKDTTQGMSIWGTQAHPLTPGMGTWGIKSLNMGLKLGPAFTRVLLITAKLPKLGEAASETGDDAESKAELEAMDTWYALARQDDRKLILRFLTVVLSDSTKGLSWLHHVWDDLIHMGKPEIPKAALDMIEWTDATAPLKERMEADWAFHCLPPEKALPIIEELDPALWGLWRAYAGGELLLRMGKKGEAKGILAGLWKAIPWHVNLTLKLYDLFKIPPIGESEDTKDVTILVYSWNKADLLADTLHSLLESDIGHAKVIALNNGSSDHTDDMLLKAQEAFGADRFRIETLPVNVGAPAARNWLLALPEVKASKWAAFLDDDIVLPKDWLMRLLGPVKNRDDIGAVGCRITAAVPPYGLQSADYNLFPIPPADPKADMVPNRVLVFDNCAGTLDTGLFTYTRTCLSVSGCCHMVNMRSIEEAGGFDLRYTPSQFDDLDRDIRSSLIGMPALFVGGLAIRHIQHSSLAQSKDVRQIGQVMGNKLKLDTKFTDEELIRLGEENQQRSWRDLKEKSTFLVDRLGMST
ncbi:glycosyltransferase family A protein [uncultured Pseudodesulfovibrio sp.]|uniref:glycosyltransferase family 2 protein n=1 Tax=uncultured Pseudodesulfovibrio sp. TaxID=2035858 RepID=UPI0029C92CDA|nr:glycosyltransferase family A protein [uncultured Pseudodesulfovibrio sp.]